MSTRINNIKMPLDWGIDNDPDWLLRAVAKQLKVSPKKIESVKLAKRSVDARKKSNVHFIVSADVTMKGESSHEPMSAAQLPVRCDGRAPVVVGSGPAGLFAALTLARAGLEPIVIERGDTVDDRAAAIARFNITGELDTQSNVQFGEGGAGTFSDGKLTTQVNNPLSGEVIDTFIAHGAPEEIAWQAKPHIGTDLLPGIIKSMREEIISLGGKVLFRTQLTGLRVDSDVDGAVRLEAIEVASQDGSVSEIETRELILAVGHSARDTYEMLRDCGLSMRQKPFSIGVRIEHSQKAIDRAQYGQAASHPALGAADYKLSCHLKNGRGVYTFCMCPGGEVVAATSEDGQVVTNGMSRFARDGENSNSALLVSVNPEDFGSDDVLAGVEFQRKWERAAFELGGGGYQAPAQLVGDFLANKASSAPGKIAPTYPRGVTFGKIDAALPRFAVDSLREALPILGRKIRGFDDPNAVMTGIESRSSAPISMDRDDSMQGNILGIYPCGEGAGHAGGIMSSAIDGIRCANALIKTRRSE